MSGLNVIRKEIPLGSVSGLPHESHSWLIDPDGVKDIPAEGTALEGAGKLPWKCKFLSFVGVIGAIRAGGV